MFSPPDPAPDTSNPPAWWPVEFGSDLDAPERVEHFRVLRLFDSLIDPESATRLSQRLLDPIERIYAQQALGCRAFIQRWRNSAGRGGVLTQDQAGSLIIDMRLARSHAGAVNFLNAIDTITYRTSSRWWHLGGLLSDPGEYDILSLTRLTDATSQHIAYKLDSYTDSR